MTQTFRARQMVPGRDTLSVMALHYGITCGTIVEIVRTAGADVIREDGFHGFLSLVDTKLRLNGEQRSTSRNRKVAGWSDGQVGVNPETTKLTRKAIRVVAQWKHQQSGENVGDN